MPVVEIHEHIDSSPDQVWALISDIEKAPEWVTVMRELVSTTDNPVREGTVYRERSKVGPGVSETKWHVTRCDAPHLQVHECHEASMRAVLTMQVEPEGTGSSFLHRTEYQMIPRFRPFGWVLEKLVVNRTMRQQLTATVQQLAVLAQSRR
jgi:uncharacterized protein YndB with AHSA1/START domain